MRVRTCVPPYLGPASDFFLRTCLSHTCGNPTKCYHSGCTNQPKINSAQMCPWWMSARIQTSHTQRANDPRRLRVWTPANDTESCTQRHVFQPTPPPPHIDTPATLTKKNVIVAGVAWVAWQWWENWEGICEVEFSLSLSLYLS